MPIPPRKLALAAGLLLAHSSLAYGQETSPPPRTPDHPTPVSDRTWFQSVSAQQRVLTNQHCPVIFIGDSLTEFWTSIGAQAWAAHMAPLHAADVGLAGDRTENVLWRIQHLDFRRAQPGVFVLLMGTNNLAMNPPDAPEAVVKGIERAVGELLRRFPASRLLLLELPPNGFEPHSELRQRVQATNAILEQVTWPKAVRLISLYSPFVTSDDHWKPGQTLDGTHFSAAGYQTLANLLAEPLREALDGSPDAPKKP